MVNGNRRWYALLAVVAGIASSLPATQAAAAPTDPAASLPPGVVHIAKPSPDQIVRPTIIPAGPFTAPPQVTHGAASKSNVGRTDGTATEKDATAQAQCGTWTDNPSLVSWDNRRWYLRVSSGTNCGRVMWYQDLDDWIGKLKENGTGVEYWLLVYRQGYAWTADTYRELFIGPCKQTHWWANWHDATYHRVSDGKYSDFNWTATTSRLPCTFY